MAFGIGPGFFPLGQWDPSQSSLVMHARWRADRRTLDGATLRVTQLTDIGATASRHAVQATSGNMPLLTESDAHGNGKSSVTFDGADDSLLATIAYPSLNDITVYMVARRMAASGGPSDALFSLGGGTVGENDYDNAGRLMLRDDTTTPIFGTYRNSYEAHAALTPIPGTGVTFGLELIINNGSSDIRWNGTSHAATGATDAPITATRCALAARLINGAIGSDFNNLKLFEMYILEGALTPGGAESLKHRAYCNARYGTAF